MNDLPSGLGGAIALVFGASVGSFVSAVAYRLPRELSILRPRSFCPSCERPIPIALNVPILSYIGLRGRCLMCGAAIPFRYFLAEITLAVAALYLYLTFPMLDALARFSLCAALFAASLIDYDWRIIPDVISIPGIAVGFLAATFVVPEVGWRSSLIGFAIGGVFLFAVAEVYRLLRGREGMGMGDVKLLAMVGAFLGSPGVIFTLFFGSLLGSLGGVGLALSRRRAASAPSKTAPQSKPRDLDLPSTIANPLPDQAGEADEISILQTAVPFGPFLSLAAAVYALFQPQLTYWYLSR